METKLKVEYVPIEAVKPYDGNAKLHPDDQIERIAKSITEFGFNDPIAVWADNEIIEGHGRLQAAKKLGLKKVPIIRLDGLTDAQRRAYGLVHNKLTMDSDFDPDALAAELENLPDMSAYDFELPELPEQPEEPDDTEASLRRNVFENITKGQYDSESYYGIPELKATKTVGSQLLRYCDYNQIKDHENYIAHFYYDD